MSKRALWDTTITEVLAGYYEPDAQGRLRPESLYGSLKMWAHLNREGIAVARCTVERLMKANGWAGVTAMRRHGPRFVTPRPSSGPPTWWTASSPAPPRTCCGLPTSPT